MKDGAFASLIGKSMAGLVQPVWLHCSPSTRLQHVLRGVNGAFLCCCDASCGSSADALIQLLSFLAFIVDSFSRLHANSALVVLEIVLFGRFVHL